MLAYKAKQVIKPSKLIINIDINDTLTNNLSLYFHPDRLESLSSLGHKMFDSVIIKNCRTKNLKHHIFLNIFKALKPLAEGEIKVCKESNNNENYSGSSEKSGDDLSLLESIAKSVGFDNFKKDYKLNKLYFVKPEKPIRLLSNNNKKQYSKEFTSKDEIKLDIIKAELYKKMNLKHEINHSQDFKHNQVPKLEKMHLMRKIEINENLNKITSLTKKKLQGK